VLQLNVLKQRLAEDEDEELLGEDDLKLRRRRNQLNSVG
jgi:hypothetical protein